LSRASQGVSIRGLSPSLHPDCISTCRKAAMPDVVSGSQHRSSDGTTRRDRRA
jgi:hypothetical protein